jgi:hypothetical protein
VTDKTISVPDATAGNSFNGNIANDSTGPTKKRSGQWYGQHAGCQHYHVGSVFSTVTGTPSARKPTR